MEGRHVALFCIICSLLAHRIKASEAEVTVKVSPQPAVAKLLKCVTDFQTTTWDGKPVRVCDPEICKGAPKMQLLEKPRGSAQQRRPEGSWRRFLSSLKEVDGWLVLDHILFVQLFTRYQLDNELLGAVGEIGVHHGKFWMPIVSFSLGFEPAVAVDLFEDQEKNFDGSGHGSKTIFLKNAFDMLGMKQDELTLLAGDSMGLSGRDFNAKGLPRFRLLSVDGGHSLETTLHDMTLAACLLRDGGIMVVDDVVMHPEGKEGAERYPWTGVPSAVFPWILSQDRWAPFLWGHDKLYLTTVSHHKELLQLVVQFPGVKCAHTLQDMHPSRHAIGRHLLCVNMKKALSEDDLLLALLSGSKKQSLEEPVLFAQKALEDKQTV